jgi:glyoxylase-like metal-dependent hydrolase (beta-lactamase superfamily II)
VAAGEQHVSRRRFDEVEAAVISSGEIAPHDGFETWRLPGGWAAAQADRNARGQAVIGINALYVKTPSATIIVDPSSFTRADRLEPFVDLHPGPPIDDALAALAVDPQEVTAVLITHGHFDHLSGVISEPRAERGLRFPAAVHYFPAADYDAFVANPPPPPEGHPYGHELLRALERTGRLEFVDGDREVLPGIELIHTGAETAGHQIVRVQTATGALYYLGDLFHLPVEFEYLPGGPQNRDHAELEAVRRRVLATTDLAAEGTTAVFTHGRFPAWGAIEPAADGGWRWRYG